MFMKRQVQKGFTLIELMIVVAIIGILAAIAIPQYQDYVTRSRWASAITSLDATKKAWVLCMQNNSNAFGTCNTLGADNLDLRDATGAILTALPTPPGATAALTISGTTGAIAFTGDAKLAGCTMTITPQNMGGTSWVWNHVPSGGTKCNKSTTGFGS